MLRDFGHEVFTITRHNDDQQGIRGKFSMAAGSIWSRTAFRETTDAIREYSPDIVHCNNLFPQLSPSVAAAARHAGIPVVHALRNYRHFCVNSFFLRAGKVCTDCLGRRLPTDGIRHRCYRGSRTASSVVATMQIVHKALDAWKKNVDIFFTPSAFARSVYIKGGFDEAKITTKPNFIDPDPGFSNEPREFALFIGRLSQEKGISSLLEAWDKLEKPCQLKIVGDGPMREEVKARISGSQFIEYAGSKPHAEILKLLGQAKFLVMPSLWYETFGRTIVEAYSRGTPAIVSDLGAMAELVDNGVTGLKFSPGSPLELAKAVDFMLARSESEQEEFRHAARRRYLERFTASKNMDRLIDIYDMAIKVRK